MAKLSEIMCGQQAIESKFLSQKRNNSAERYALEKNNNILISLLKQNTQQIVGLNQPQQREQKDKSIENPNQNLISNKNNTFKRQIKHIYTKSKIQKNQKTHISIAEIQDLKDNSLNLQLQQANLENQVISYQTKDSNQTTDPINERVKPKVDFQLNNTHFSSNNLTSKQVSPLTTQGNFVRPYSVFKSHNLVSLGGPEKIKNQQTFVSRNRSSNSVQIGQKPSKSELELVSFINQNNTCNSKSNKKFAFQIKNENRQKCEGTNQINKSQNIPQNHLDSMTPKKSILQSNQFDFTQPLLTKSQLKTTTDRIHSKSNYNYTPKKIKILKSDRIIPSQNFNQVTQYQQQKEQIETSNILKQFQQRFHSISNKKKNKQNQNLSCLIQLYNMQQMKGKSKSNQQQTISEFGITSSQINLEPKLNVNWESNLLGTNENKQSRTMTLFDTEYDRKMNSQENLRQKRSNISSQVDLSISFDQENGEYMNEDQKPQIICYGKDPVIKKQQQEKQLLTNYDNDIKSQIILSKFNNNKRNKNYRNMRSSTVCQPLMDSASFSSLSPWGDEQQGTGSKNNMSSSNSSGGSQKQYKIIDEECFTDFININSYINNGVQK